MSQTLEEFLGDQARLYYQDRLTEVLDVSTWTKENRDSKFAELEEISGQVSENALTILRTLFETEIEGHPVVYWKILEQFQLAQIEVLNNFRDQLDVASDTELDNAPVDYEWVITRLRTKYKEVSSLDSKLRLALTQIADTTEEL